MVIPEKASPVTVIDTLLPPQSDYTRTAQLDVHRVATHASGIHSSALSLVGGSRDVARAHEDSKPLQVTGEETKPGKHIERWRMALLCSTHANRGVCTAMA